MSNINNNNNNNNLELSSTAPYSFAAKVGGLGLLVGLGSKYSKLSKGIGEIVSNGVVRTPEEFISNKMSNLKSKMNLLEHNGQINSEEYKNIKNEFDKYNSHMYYRAANDYGDGAKAAEEYAKKNNIEMKPLSNEEISSIEKELEERKRNIGNEYAQKAESVINKGTIGAGALTVGGAAGEYIVNKKNKEKFNNYALTKMSSILTGDTEDEEDKYDDGIVTDLSKNKTGSLVGLGMGSLIGSYGLKHGAKMMETQGKVAGNYVKNLANESNNMSRENEALLERYGKPSNMPEDVLKKYEENKTKIKLNLTKQEVAAARTALTNSSLASWAEKLKWFSVAPLAVGAAGYLNKKLNPSNPSLINNDDTAETISTIGNIGSLAGLGLIAAGSHRPFIKPMLNTFKAARKGNKDINLEDLYEGTSFSQAKDVDKIKEEIESKKPEDFLTEAGRNAAKDEAAKDIEVAKKSIEDVPFKNDLRAVGIGSGLFGTGVTASSMTPNQKEIDTTQDRRDTLRKTLLKQSSELRLSNYLYKEASLGSMLRNVVDKTKNVGKNIKNVGSKAKKYAETGTKKLDNVSLATKLGIGGLAGTMGTGANLASKAAEHFNLGALGELGIPLGAHVLQNIYMTHLVNNGYVGRKALEYVKAGNKGKFNTTKIGQFLEGLHHGTLAPDMSVVRKEALEYGKMFKEKGIDFENLDPHDKLFLESYLKGDIKKMLDSMHNSKVASVLMSKVMGSSKKASVIQEAMQRAKQSLTPEDEEAIRNSLKDSSFHHLAEAMVGKDTLGRKLNVNSDYSGEVIRKAFDNKVGRFFSDKMATPKKVIDKILSKHNKEMDIEEAERIRTGGHITGGLGTMLVDPLVGGWNMVKPWVSSTPIAEKLTSAILAGDASREILGQSTKGGMVSGAASSLLLSPTFSLVTGGAGLTGKTINEIIKRGLTKEEYNKIINNKDLQETAAAPVAKLFNGSINAIAKLKGLNNLEAKIEAPKERLVDKAVGDVKDVLGEGITKGHIDNEKLADLADAYGEEAGNAVVDASTKAANKLNNLNLNAGLNRTTEASEALTHKYGLPGTIAGAALLSTPALSSSYRDYKQRRREALQKTAEYNDDNTQPMSQTSSLLAGGVAGGLFGYGKELINTSVAQNNMKVEIENLKQLFKTNPKEAMKIFNEVKNNPANKGFVNSKEFKDLENHITDFHNKYIDIETNSDEVKKLKALEEKFNKMKIPTNQEKGYFIPTLKSFYHMASNKEAMDELNKIKEAGIDTSEVDKLLSSFYAKKKKVIDEFKESGAVHGKGNALLNKNIENATNVIKPSLMKVLGKTTLGAGIGAGAAYLGNKLYNSSARTQYKDGENFKEEPITDKIGIGTILGTGAGIGFMKGKNKIISSLINKTLDDPYISLEAKNSLLNSLIPSHRGSTDYLGETIKHKLFGGYGADAEKATKHGIAKPYMDLDEIKNKIHVSQKAGEMDDIVSGSIAGGSMGALAGGYIGMQSNANKRNDYALVNNPSLLLKQSNFNATQQMQQPQENHDNAIIAAPLIAGAGTGGAIGWQRSGLKQLTSQSRLDSLKEVNNTFKDINKDDFHKVFKNHQVTSDVIENLQNYNAGKKVLTSQQIKEFNEAKAKLNELLEKKAPLELNLAAYNAAKSQRNELLHGSKAELADGMGDLISKNIPKDLIDTSLGEHALIDQTDPKVEEFVRKNQEELWNHEQEISKHRDIINKHSKTILGSLDEVLPDIEREHKLIPLKGTLKGAGIGLGVGALGSALLAHDLHKNNNINQ